MHLPLGSVAGNEYPLVLNTQITIRAELLSCSRCPHRQKEMERDVLPQQDREQPAGSPNSVSELASKVLKGRSHVALRWSMCLLRVRTFGSVPAHMHTDTCIHTLGNFDLGKRDPQKSQLFLVSQFVSRQCWRWGKI